MQSAQKQTIARNKDIKKQKLNYFLQNNYNSKPNLPSTIPISQLLREYLNDDDFRILYEGQFVLSNESYHKKIEDFYQQWLKIATNFNDINQFIQYWFSSEPQLDVEYSLFDQINHENKGLDISGCFKSRSINNLGLKKVKQTGGQVQSRTIQVKPTTLSNKNQFTPIELFKQFFIFYSKKQVESINSSTFSRYQQYYNSINFSKWMCYVRDMGFLKFKKVMSLQSLKSIFIKYQNKDKCLTFELFQEAVQKCLDLIHNGNKLSIEDQGYKMIGIKSLHHFQQKFRNIGVLPPIITKDKPKRAYINSRSKINDNDSVVSKVSLLAKLQSKPRDLSSKTLKMKLKEQTAQQLQEISNIMQYNKSNKIHTQQNQSSEKGVSLLSKIVAINKKNIKINPKVKENSRLIQEMMKEEQEGDPYLKRYNNKQTVQKYHCLMNRIDQRVEKICNKY